MEADEGGEKEKKMRRCESPGLLAADGAKHFTKGREAGLLAFEEKQFS